MTDSTLDRAAEPRSPDVAVVGSINLDISIPVPHLPAPGETVLGGDALWSGGGKGANQAVAVARLGRSVAMVGAVGDDSAGREQLEALARRGVDVSSVATLEGVPTGVATITVDERAENSIVVSPGANGRVAGSRVRSARAVTDAAVVLVQFEIPLGAVRAATEAATGFVIVNPAPVPADAGSDDDDLRAVIDRADLLVPNRGELSALLGVGDAATSVELVDQAKSIGRPVIVTLGSQGALVVETDRITQIPPMPVEAVDTTAAGDSFCGALADAIVRGATLVEAATWAGRVAAVTVTRRGAQASLPTRAAVLAAP